VDVEQIMRDIRSRIAQRQGVELTNQQIQELAARRLESIIDPRSVKPALLDQLRRATGTAPDTATAARPEPPYVFNETTLYESHRGLMRFVRRLLNPILKLFFNPTPLVRALGIQARLNTEAAAREAERERRQSEWNALHYEILQRLVTEVARVSLEAQALTMKVESLSAKVDFNERRVRGIEGTMHQARPAGRRDQAEGAAVVTGAAPIETAVSDAAPPAQGAPVEGARRRRRRRRGRRGAGLQGEALGGTLEPAATTEVESDTGEPDEGAEEEDLVAAAGEDDTAVIADALALAGTDTSPTVDVPEPATAEAPPAAALTSPEPPPQEAFAPADEPQPIEAPADRPTPPPDGPERPQGEPTER
jgi:hypothetical protein